ncbi:MAG: amidinotransferase, partial [Cyanobacteria bacterium P01_A01_bin.40]
HKISITKDFLHLDFVLSIPRPGLAVVCREGFADELPEFLKGWQIIDLPFEDAQSKLACNHLVLDEKTIIVASELTQLIYELRQAGQTVIPTPMSAVYWQGGSLRCWHHPLVRESNLE